MGRRPLIGLGILAIMMLILIVGGALHNAMQNTAPQPIPLQGAGASAPSSQLDAAPAPQQPGAPAILTSPTSLSAGSTVASKIAVHVAGAVKHTGVYYLPTGSREVDFLKAAGGPSSQADTDAVNLAAIAQDGTQLYIPTKREHPYGGAEPVSSAAEQPASSVPDTIPQSAAIPKHSAASHGRSNKMSDPSQGRVSINNATAAELERVPDIGPAMAAKILAFRQQNGRFQSMNDLMQVSGIGPKKFARMSPFLKL